MTGGLPRGPFHEGERVQLTGPKGRRNTITLRPGELFHSHRGTLAHDDVLGKEDGSVVQNSAGEQFLALRPLLVDFVMSMPRGAAIIYPKDSAQIIGQADVFPGATVVEAGVGSGALSLWLLRAVGSEGRLYSFERREEFASIAQANGAAFFGESPANWTVTVGDLADALPGTVPPGSADRVILDMLAPWENLDAVTTVLRPGGILVCYVATVTQLSRTAEAIRATGRFTHPQSNETMVRGWHVEGLAVRPDHRMIAHTGFLISARLLAEGTELPELKRRPSKTDFSEADVEAWTPGALGDRPLSEKRLRKTVRRADEAAQARLDGETDGEADRIE